MSADLLKTSRRLTDNFFPLFPFHRPLVLERYLMSYHSRRMNRRYRVAAAVCLSAFLISCGGKGTPTAPTPATAAAAVSIINMSVQSERTATGYRYTIRFTARETGGGTGVNLGTVNMTFSDASRQIGTTTYDTAFVSPTLAPGGSTDSRTLVANDENPNNPAATRVQVQLVFTATTGIAGAATQTADVPALAPLPPAARFFTLAGVVTDANTMRPVGGATVRAADTVGTSRTSVTDGNGYYSAPTLREGSVSLLITAIGYQIANRTVSLSGDTRLDILVAPTAPPPPTAPSPPPTTPSCGPTNASCGVATARCNDGTYSCSQNRPGTCSQHNGVACWICPGRLCSGDERQQAASLEEFFAATVGGSCGQ